MPRLSVKHLRLKAGGLSLASKGGDDRQLDERPTRDGCTILGKRSQVLLPNIFGSVEVCVKLIAALAAKEDGLRTAIGTMLIATARTGLGGQPGVNCDDGDTTLLGLVEGEGVQLGKRPAVQPAFVLDIPVSLAASYAGGLADIREVLEDEGRPGRGIGDEAFGEDMICVSGSLFQGFQPLEERKSRRFRKQTLRHLDGLELRGGFAALLGFSHLPGVGGLMFALPREGALQGFGGLHSGLNEQVGDQPLTGRFGVVVGGVVQPDPVLLPALPPVATDSVESDGKLSKRLMQGDRLLWGRIQLYAHRSVHIFLFFLPACKPGRHTNVL